MSAQLRFALLRLPPPMHSRGITLIEILVSSIIGILVLGVALGFTVSNRNIFERDTDRIQVNQNLNAALEIMGNDIRQAGERISQPGFPAVQVTADELILRRRPVSSELQLCQDVAGGAAEVIVSQNPVITPGCSATADAITDWVTESADAPGYIYDAATRSGEFFVSGAGGDAFSVLTTGLSGDYDEADRHPLYLLEERRYQLGDDGILRLTVIGADGGTVTQQVLEIANRITDMEIRVAMVGNAATQTLFGADAADLWTQIRNVQVTLVGETDIGFGNTQDQTVTSRFYPRNAASRN